MTPRKKASHEVGKRRKFRMVIVCSDEATANVLVGLANILPKAKIHEVQLPEGY